MPLVFLIQEYEPHLLPFSSAHLLAREAYDTPPRLWGIFNSSNLHSYFTMQGHASERVFTFEPVINDALRPYLDQVGSSTRKKRILVYGRPAIPRNCFPALVRGLRHWAAHTPDAAEWEIVSAGMAHKPIALGNGCVIRPVGKLSLDDYAQLLLTSRVGVSLMASPHPSYPPLEMAHLGLRTVTNTYIAKPWSPAHPHIHAVSSIAEEPLAEAITLACDASAKAPVIAPDPAYLRSELYPFLNDLAQGLQSELAQTR